MEPVELFVTETWLRQNCTLAHGSELRLPAEAKLTPAAQGLLSDRRIQVFFGEDIDEQEESLEEPACVEAEAPKQDMPTDLEALKQALKQEILCEIWKDFALAQKPVCAETSGQTTGNGSKCEAKLRLQAKLDSTLAQTALLLAQAKADHEQNEFYINYLSDVYNALYSLVNAEKVTVISDKLIFAGLDSEAIGEMMCKPEQYLGCSHFRCDGSQGVRVAQLETLRTQVFEIEQEARIAYTTYDFRTLRQDILSVLNQSVRAVYLLMLLVFSSEQQGKNNS